MADNKYLNKPKGLICPECGANITVTLEMLVFNKTFKCPECKLELEIDRQASGDVIESLKKVYDAQQEIRKVRKSF